MLRSTLSFLCESLLSDVSGNGQLSVSSLLVGMTPTQLPMQFGRLLYVANVVRPPAEDSAADRDDTCDLRLKLRLNGQDSASAPVQVKFAPGRDAVLVLVPLNGLTVTAAGELECSLLDGDMEIAKTSLLLGEPPVAAAEENDAEIAVTDAPAETAGSIGDEAVLNTADVAAIEAGAAQ